MRSRGYKPRGAAWWQQAETLAAAALLVTVLMAARPDVARATGVCSEGTPSAYGWFGVTCSVYACANTQDEDHYAVNVQASNELKIQLRAEDDDRCPDGKEGSCCDYPPPIWPQTNRMCIPMGGKQMIPLEATWGGPLSITWDTLGPPGTATTTVNDPCADACDVSSEYTVTYPATGHYTVVATVEDDVVDEEAKDPDIQLTFDISVLPPALDCDAEPYSCLGAGNGGCASGCGDANGAPGPDLRTPVVAFGAGSLGDLGPGADGWNTGGSGCPSFRVRRSCIGWHALYVNSCGLCGPVPPLSIDGTAAVGDDNLDIDAAGDTSQGGGLTPETTITVTHVDGSKTIYEIPKLEGEEAAPFVDTDGDFTWAIGPASILDPAGVETVSFARDGETGAVESATLAGGGTWQYWHADPVFTELITRAKRPDGTYTTISYVDKGSPGEGKPETVQTYSSGDVPLSGIALHYDEEGRLTSYTSGLGPYHTVTYTYASGSITVEDSSASPAVVTEYAYGTNTTTVTRKGATPADDQVTIYTFNVVDGQKREIVSVSENGEVTLQEVDPATRRVNWVEGPDGVRTAYTYNSKGAAELVQRKLGEQGQVLSSESTTYYDDGAAETIWPWIHRDAANNWTYYIRDAQSLWQVGAIKVAGPSEAEPTWANLNSIKAFEYYDELDSGGLPGQLKSESVLDANGDPEQVTSYVYTEVFEQESRTRSAPTQTTYSWWDASLQPPAYAEKTSTASYDDMGRLRKTSDANGRSVLYEYDALGRQILTIYNWTDGDEDEVPDYTIDAETCAVTSTELTTYTQNCYVTCCGLTWSADENGNKTYYGYDGANRLAKTWTDIDGQGANTPLVSYTYDAFGNQQTVTTRSDSSTSRVTSYDYDSANRVTKIEYPGEIVGDEEFGYDDAGGLLWKKDGNGKFTLYEYDDLHRLIAVYYLPGALPNPISYQGLTADVTYTYHGGTNQRETMADAAGTSEFEYDEQGRLKTYTPPLGLDTGYYLEYAYNNAGQKTGVKIWNGTTASYDVSYEYYANGWLKAVKYGGNTIASYSYDAVGNRTQVDYGNGTYTAFEYEESGNPQVPPDPRYRLGTITHNYGATELAKFGYTRDNVGNPVTISWRQNSTTFEWEYDYDAMNRLASAAPPEEGPLFPLPAQAGGTYSYDWVGNMKAAALSNAWQYNAADQLTAWPGMHSYEYDDNGALTAVKTADGQTEQQSFTYYPTGLLNTATFNNQTQTLTNLWDADEHRVQFSIGEHSYTAVFDVTAGVPAVIKEVTPQGTVYYIREPGGELICLVVGNDKWFYHFDELGSTRLITDNSSPAVVTDRYSYDAYGALISHDRNTGTIDQPYQYVGQLGYYTHYQAPEIGWLQLGVRFYDPETGRFERQDPLVQFTSSYYCYASSSPLAAADPTGEFGWTPGLRLPRHYPKLDGLYGKYCGPQLRPGRGKPIDALDTCCKEHDDAWSRLGCNVFNQLWRAECRAASRELCNCFASLSSGSRRMLAYRNFFADAYCVVPFTESCANVAGRWLDNGVRGLYGLPKS